MQIRQEEFFIRVEIGQQIYESNKIKRNNPNFNFPVEKVFQRHAIVIK